MLGPQIKQSGEEMGLQIDQKKQVGLLQGKKQTRVFQKSHPLSIIWAKREVLGSGGEFIWKFRWWRHGQVILVLVFVKQKKKKG